MRYCPMPLYISPMKNCMKLMLSATGSWKRFWMNFAPSGITLIGNHSICFSILVASGPCPSIINMELSRTASTSEFIVKSYWRQATNADSAWLLMSWKSPLPTESVSIYMISSHESKSPILSIINPCWVLMSSSLILPAPLMLELM